TLDLKETEVVCADKGYDSEPLREQIRKTGTKANIPKNSVHDKFHRALVLSGFFFLKIASTFLNSSFFPKPIKR
ncbi:hypothetical protein ABLU18_16735, partial [Acinetobacter junii]